MASQTRCEIRVSVPTPPIQTSTVSIRDAPQIHRLNDTTSVSSTCLPHPQSASTAPDYASNLSNGLSSAQNGSTPSSQQSTKEPGELSASIGESKLSTARTTLTSQNPKRPPPYTYQRQYEFPPFPPLARHPVLPFLTTAFSNPPENQPSPSKSRPSIAPRASTTQRHVQSNLSVIPTMDVSKMDPTATFIRPPFLVPFTRKVDNVDPSALNGVSANGEPAPGTPLTYAILHAHRDWFLDPEDFCKDNPNRIDYPSTLEPPRGWAPLVGSAEDSAKCKQPKDGNERTNRTKGSYAHAGNALIDLAVPYGPTDEYHDKTVLRCTFCRREYHGPNAKSMWRRHVYDKHKVAMRNRREGSAGMAPKASFPKKGKPKDAGSYDQTLSLGPPLSSDTPGLTLDLTNEQNLIRLLERIVNGNLEISLPASLLNSQSSDDGDAPSISLQTIALAFQKSGIPLSLEKGPMTNSSPEAGPEPSRDHEEDLVYPGDHLGKAEGDNLGALKRSTDLMESAAVHKLSSPSPSSLVENTQPASVEVSRDSYMSDNNPAARSIGTSPRPDTASLNQESKAEVDHVGQVHISDRVPFKDNTALARNNHNSNTRVVPGTPRKDKGKQRALPRTPGGSKLSQGGSPITSPSLRHPYTPTRQLSSTALRARALATTGQESYLTLVLNSPDPGSPVRNTGRASFASPFNCRAPHMKTKSKDGEQESDGALRMLGHSSPSYSFDFNLVGTQNCGSYLTGFDQIPFEVGALAPTPWTPPALGPPAPLSEPTSRTMSRASSVVNDLDVKEDREANKWASGISTGLRLNHDKTSHEEDFDMEVFLDLEDAGPASSPGLVSSPHKTVRREFSKEFGLLSPEEVERITASARPSFEAEARSFKRRKVDDSS